MPDEPFGENVGLNPCIKRGTKISKKYYNWRTNWKCDDETARIHGNENLINREDMVKEDEKRWNEFSHLFVEIMR